MATDNHPLPPAQPSLAEHAAEIKRLGKRVIRDIIEIGRHLAEAKEIVGRGNWVLWLTREFGWTERTARNFMQVHEQASKSAKFAGLSLPISSLYLLAAPSTPDEARDEVIEWAERGARLSVVDVKRTIAKHNPSNISQAPSAPKLAVCKPGAHRLASASIPARLARKTSYARCRVKSGAI